jgi:hypothetical protein
MKKKQLGTPKKIGWVLKNFEFLGFGLDVGCHTQHPTQNPKKNGFQCMVILEIHDKNFFKKLP